MPHSPSEQSIESNTSAPRRRWRIVAPPWHIVLRKLFAAALFLSATCIVPQLWCGREANGWYDGDLATQSRLANTVEAALNRPRTEISTGSDRFDGEWNLMTTQLSGLGFGQMATEHPAETRHAKDFMAKCAARLLTSEARGFDTTAWHKDAMSTLDGPAGHAGYLGYTNSLLSYIRLLDSNASTNAVNDRISSALERRFWQSKTGLIETYPDETYPADNCVAMASLVLNARARGRDISPMVRKWVTSFRSKCVDVRTGLVYQALDSDSGDPTDSPRASGTLFSAYFLSFVDPALSQELFAAVRKTQVATLAGFSAIREYAPGSAPQSGDIDSGPVIAGLSMSGTAFVLASARIHGDRTLFRSVYATAYLVASPVDTRAGQTHLIGGPLGNALMFALLTARRQQP